MCFVFIFTHILDLQTMLLFSAAVKISIIILLFLHFFSLKKNDINAISPSHFPSIPPSFRLHHHHLSAIISPPSSSSCRHHSASIIITIPYFSLITIHSTIIFPHSSSSLHHHLDSIPIHSSIIFKSHHISTTTIIQLISN